MYLCIFVLMYLVVFGGRPTFPPLRLVLVQFPFSPFSPVYSPRANFTLSCYASLLCQRDKEVEGCACLPACLPGGTECSLLCDVSHPPLGMEPISLADHKLLKNISCDLYFSKIALSASSPILYTQWDFSSYPLSAQTL